MIYYNQVNTSYPIHTHAQHFTIGIVINGEILVQTNSDKFICKADNIFTIPTDTPHSIKPNNDCSYTMLVFCIQQDFLLNSNPETIEAILKENLNQILHENQNIDKYCTLIKNELNMVIENKLDQFTKNSYYEEMKNRLLQIPELHISVKVISQEIFISSFHMIRKFKNETGLTPHQFQIQCRIRKAQKMLLSKKTIAEVALDTGFYDQSHFVKCFKKIVGMTPSSYKKVARISKVQE